MLQCVSRALLLWSAPLQSCRNCLRRSRGLDQQTARQMLVYSFGKEVTQKLRYPQLQARIEDAVNAALAKAPIAQAEDA